jgi:hypothetical protein
MILSSKEVAQLMRVSTAKLRRMAASDANLRRCKIRETAHSTDWLGARLVEYGFVLEGDMRAALGRNLPAHAVPAPAPVQAGSPFIAMTWSAPLIRVAQ